MNKITKLKNKYVSLAPGVQMVCAVLLLVVLFATGDALKSLFFIKNTTIRAVFSYVGITINLVTIGLTVVVLSEGSLLLKRYIKHEPLRIDTPISNITVALMGSYASAMCFVYRELITDKMIPKPQLYIFNTLSWILFFCGIAILLISAIKLILCINKE